MDVEIGKRQRKAVVACEALYIISIKRWRENHKYEPAFINFFISFFLFAGS